MNNNTGWPKSHVTEKQSNVSVMAHANELIFSPIIEACSYSIFIRTRLEREPVLSTAIDFNENILASHI
jgi:hypothetical protein